MTHEEIADRDVPIVIDGSVWHAMRSLVDTLARDLQGQTEGNQRQALEWLTVIKAGLGRASVLGVVPLPGK